MTVANNNTKNQERNNYRRRNNHRSNYNQKANQNSNSQQTSVVMPLSFVRSLMRQVTNNPQNPSSRKSRTYSIYSKENILKWLQSPTSSSNEKSLRDASNYMYISSMHYNRLLNYYAGIYVGSYVISPLDISESTDRSAFLKEYKKISRVIKNICIPKLLRETILISLRDGAYYGVLLSDNNSAFIMPIDPEYCKITSICDGSFLYKVDMTKIASKLEFYPAEFSKMYAEYVKTGEQWQEVPPEISVCIKADSTTTDYAIPPFAAVMPSSYTIANAEALTETSTELKNYKMLSGKVPLDQKGNPLMPDDVVQKYYAHISNALGVNVGLSLSPFEFTPFSFENKSGVTDVDDVSNAVANFWSTAGTSGLLHGRENSTSGVAKLAIKNDETYVLGLVQQVEKVINRWLKVGFSNSTKFEISILPITVFNREEFLKYYEKAVSFGIGKSQYAAALGIPLCDIEGLNYMETKIIPFDKLRPLKSSYTSGANEETGRPNSSDNNLDDAGEKTRDGDTNANK